MAGLRTRVMALDQIPRDVLLLLLVRQPGKDLEGQAIQQSVLRGPPLGPSPPFPRGQEAS